MKIATVALANKTARVAWSVMARNEVYAAAAAVATPAYTVIYTGKLHHDRGR